MDVWTDVEIFVSLSDISSPGLLPNRKLVGYTRVKEEEEVEEMIKALSLLSRTDEPTD